MHRQSLLLIVAITASLVAPQPVNGGTQAGLHSQSAGLPLEITHVVQPGETLFSIAESYGSTVDALAHANGLADPTTIYAGQKLSIPDAATRLGSLPLITYVVQAGDSLPHIARRYGIPWRNLARLNALVSPHGLRTREAVSVPVEDRDRRPAGRLHYVRAGELLHGIALRYDVPPYHLIEANLGFFSLSTYQGQVMLIPGEAESGLPAPFESVDVQPASLRQGESVVIHVEVTEPVTLTGKLFDRSINFVEQDGAHFGLAGVHVFTDPGTYDLRLEALDSEGSVLEIGVDVVVGERNFGYERIPAPPSLLDPSVVAPERELLEALRPTFTDERLWTTHFDPPCGGTVSSYFGSRRAYNEGPYTSYHAGLDLRGATGTPVHAPAAGTVVMAEALTVRGNALMLDHGWGVLSGYWHLSAIEVEEGQSVQKGELIGRVGNSGLSTGSHLHWEMWVGGVNVDPVQWLECFYPWPECGDSQEAEDPT